MKKDLRGRSSLWVLLVSYTALFVLLVVVKNLQFWHMRKTSYALVEVVSNSYARHAAFAESLNQNLGEQNSVLNFLNSSSAEKSEIPASLSSKIKENDSTLALNVSMLNSLEEKGIFQQLRAISNQKRDEIISFFSQLEQQRYLAAVETYQSKLAPEYRKFQLLNKNLLQIIDANNKQLISKKEGLIITIGQVNVWISGALILVMLFLGYNLIKIGKINRRTNLELKENERKYRSLTEQTNEIIQKCDAEGKLVFANDSFKKTFDYTDEELTQLSFHDILEKGKSTLIECPVEGEEVISHVQEVFKSKSGKRIFLEGNIVAEYKNGAFAGTMGFFNNVTEKKQLEESLVSSELKFRTFFNVAPIPMWAVDPLTYQFVLVNQAALSHYGYSEKEFLNKKIMDLRREDELSKIEADVSKIRKDISCDNPSKIYRYNVNHFKKTGEKIEVEIYTSPITLDGKKCVLTIALDVTERNQYENKITKAIIKTQEDERYEIGSELHDNVCQILAAAGINLSRLKPSLNTSDMEVYNQSSGGIRLATEEIRNLSHRLAPAFFDNTTLEEAFGGLLRSFNLHDTCKVSLCFDDAVKNYPLNQEIQLNLYRILQEQLRNIIKYAKCNSIDIRLYMIDNTLTMSIADDGNGFDLSEIKGGIGLANMKRRAELFGGELHINSSPGKGCELLIVIPV